MWNDPWSHEPSLLISVDAMHLIGHGKTRWRQLWGYPSLHCKLRQIHIYGMTRTRIGNHTWYSAIATESHFKAMLWLSLWIPSNINYKPTKIRYGHLIKLEIMMDIEPIQARIIIMYKIACQSHEVTESATRRSFEVPHIYIRYVSISRWKPLGLWAA